MTALLVAALLLADPLRGKQHLEAPPPEKSLGAEVKEVTASTTLPDWKGYNFSPKNLVDGSVQTSWQPKTNKKKGGAGEWVKVELKRECTLERLEVANGLQMFDKLGNLFHENNRVAEAKLVFSDGTEQVIALEANDFGYVQLDLPAKKTTSSLRVEIVSIHKGTKWPDLAISELGLFGTCP